MSWDLWLARRCECEARYTRDPDKALDGPQHDRRCPLFASWFANPKVASDA